MKHCWNVGWGLTRKCNLDCAHCYNASGKRGTDELDLEQMKKVVDKLYKNNVLSVNYGTGECGLISEFWEIIRYVNEKKIVQGLTTNGASVTEDTINQLEVMNDMDVSIDFANSKKHNLFRGHPKSFQMAVNALKLLKEHSIPRAVVTCLTSQNCDEENLNGMLNITRKYDAEFRINFFRPTGRGKVNNQFKLSTKQAHDAVKFLLENTIIRALPDPYLAGILNLKTQAQGCPCGKESFRITPNGTVVPCVYFTKEITNKGILDADFNDITNSEPFEAIRSFNPSGCEGCEHKAICRGGCASRAYLEYGTLNKGDAICYKLNGLKENPLGGVSFDYENTSKDSAKVHENYLCTMIMQPK